MNLLVKLSNLVEAAWRQRAGLPRPGRFGAPAAERRSRFWATAIVVMVALFVVTLVADAIYLLWSAFTIHVRRPR